MCCRTQSIIAVRHPEKDAVLSAESAQIATRTAMPHVASPRAYSAWTRPLNVLSPILSMNKVVSSFCFPFTST